MKFILNEQEVNDIQFSDYLEVETFSDNIYFFNVSWSNKNGFYFTCEDEQPIKKIHLFNSKMILFYLSGDVREVDEDVRIISINDKVLKKRSGFGIEGNLLIYSESMAKNYDLNRSKAEKPYSSHYIKKRKRTPENKT